MKHAISAKAALYGPTMQKTFAGALGAFLADQCPQLGGELSRKALVQAIVEMVLKFYPETSHLRPGQTPWVAVHKDEKGSYGKTIDKSELVPVVLEIVGKDDVEERKDGKSLRELKKDATARLCKQAYEQDGCLTQVDISIMLKVGTPTIAKYMAEWELEHGEVLPRRGTIHDMGPTLTHKKIIIQSLFIDKKSVQQTSRETFHSFEAIQRYIGTFKKVLLCYRKNLTKEEICVAAGHSSKLIQQYLDLIEEFKEKGVILEQVAQFDAKIESHYEQNAINEELPSDLSPSQKEGLK